MNDQAQKLRELATRSRAGEGTGVRTAGPCRMITVASGKGGVGKSVFSANLALSLARLNRRVTIVDADLGLSTVNILLDARPQYDLCDVIEGRVALEQCVTACRGGAVRLVQGGSGIARMANLPQGQVEYLVRCLERLRREADFLIVDCGAGISDTVIRFCLAADEVAVVATPEPTSVADAYALIKTVFTRNPGADMRLCVNICRNKQDADSVSRRIRGVCRQFIGSEPGDAGYIAQDPFVAVSVRERVPFVESRPDSDSSRQIRKIAEGFARRTCVRSVTPVPLTALSADLAQI
jgi:flagellar biosynthesis protein FlhG